MILEVPSLKLNKPIDIFNFIKLKMDIENISNISYYTISDEIIYVVEDKENHNLLSAKLIKNLLKNNIHSFATININKSIIKKEGKDDKIEEKISIVTIHKGIITQNIYPMDKSSLLSLVMNNLETEGMDFYYVKDDRLEKFKDEVVAITGIDEDRFIETNGSVNTEDFNELIKSPSAVNNILGNYLEKFNTLIPKNKENENKKDSNIDLNKSLPFLNKLSKNYVIPTIVVTGICIIGYAGYNYNEERKAEEAAKMQELAFQEEQSKQKEQLKTIKLKENLLKMEVIKYLAENEKITFVKYNNKKYNIIMDKNYYIYNDNISKIKVDSKFMFNDRISLKNINDKELIKSLNVDFNVSTIKSFKKSTDYLILSNELNGMYMKNGKDKYTLTLKLNKKEFEDNLEKIFLNNEDTFNFLISYSKESELYSVIVYQNGKTKQEPQKPKEEKKPEVPKEE